MRIIFFKEDGKIAKEFTPAAVNILNGVYHDGSNRSGLDIKFPSTESVDSLRAFFSDPKNLYQIATSQVYSTQVGVNEEDQTPVYEKHTSSVEYLNCNILISITNGLFPQPVDPAAPQMSFDNFGNAEMKEYIVVRLLQRSNVEIDNQKIKAAFAAMGVTI